MTKKDGKKKEYAVGLGVLAVASVLCLKGMKKVDGRLKAKAEKQKNEK